MAGRIPEDVLDTIRERCSIVEVVSAHVALKKSGRGYSGLCPFHAEKTPSFTVNDERGLYHCFGCGEGGTVFTFLMKMEGLDFRAAAEQLAQRAGVALPEDGERPERDNRRRLMQLNEAAQRRYVEALRSGPGAEARSYLQQRGLDDATVERYGIGFCPANGSDFLRTVSARPQALEAALEIGLVGRRDDGRLFDRQWGRVTFPIRDGSGRVVGFGGRALGERQPKYLNSPESSLFHKGSLLYGLYEARTALRDSDRVVLVEGYMDVVSLAQHGIGNVVANLGTALTESQLRLARRFASRVIVFFDGDRAGQAAALRTFDLCVDSGLWAFGAFLPDGEDPDTFVRRHGVERTRALLDSAVSLEDFFLERIDPGPRAALPEREAAAKRVGEVLKKISDPVRFALLSRRAAERLGIDESALRQMRAGPPVRSRPAGGAGERGESPAPAVPEERLGVEEATLLEVMILDRGACGIALEMDVVDRLLGARAAGLAHAILDAWDDQGSGAPAIDRLPAALQGRVSAGLMGEGPHAGVDPTKIARDCVARLEERWVEERIRELRREYQRAHERGDREAEGAKLREISELHRRRRCKGGDAVLAGEDVA